jgi:hypothetical protein
MEARSRVRGGFRCRSLNTAGILFAFRREYSLSAPDFAAVTVMTSPASRALFVLLLLPCAQLRAQDFYPLAIGNRWDYTMLGRDLPPTPPNFMRDTSAMTATDTVRSAGHPYGLSRNDPGMFAGAGGRLLPRRSFADAPGAYFLAYWMPMDTWKPLKSKRGGAFRGTAPSLTGS